MSHRAMLAGLAAGLALGLLAASTGSELLAALAAGVEPLGELFLRAVRMVVIPLVVATVFAGVCALGAPGRLGRLGGATLAFFWGTTLAGIALGMGLMRLGLPFSPAVRPEAEASGVREEIPGVVEFLLRLVPPNPLAAAADGELLPLLVFTVLFAAAAGTLEEARRARLEELATGVRDALVRLVRWILWTAPLGIFGLVAPATASAGVALLQSMGVFIAVVALATGIFLAAVYAPLLRLLGRRSPLDFARRTLGTYAMGFGSTSSVASYPVMLRDARALGVSESVAGLVLSLGAALNRAGTAVFQGAAVVFLAHVYGVALPAAALASAFVATFFVAMTVAPVPSAGVVTLAPALEAAGVPLEGMALLLGIDRIPDMFRSATNITGHVAAAVVVGALVADEPRGGSLARPPHPRSSS